MTLRVEEELSSGRETCPSANLSTTNLTWTGLGLSPCLEGQKQETNGLSHNTVQKAFNLNWKLCTEFFMTVGAFFWCEGTEVFKL
jgi:hypothetical protein